MKFIGEENKVRRTAEKGQPTSVVLFSAVLRTLFSRLFSRVTSAGSC